MPLIHVLLYAAINIGSLRGQDVSSHVWGLGDPSPSLVIDLNENNTDYLDYLVEVIDLNENNLTTYLDYLVESELVDLANCNVSRYVPPTQVSHLKIGRYIIN